MSDYPIVALGSGKASTIEFFCKKALSEKGESFQIQALVTENPRSGVLSVAKKFHRPAHVVEHKNKSFKLWDQELFEILWSYKPRLILLAGFLKKIGPMVLHQFPGQIINSHPSLLPEFSGPGMYGLKVHQAVIQAQKTFTGVSVHVVTKNYDEGPLLAQKKIAVKKGESALELEKRVKKIEKDFYFKTVIKIIRKEITLSKL